MARSRPVGALRVERVEGTARLSAIAREWTALARAAAEPNPLYEPAMALPALNHLDGGANVSWLLFWRDEAADSELIGMFPLTVGRFHPLLPVRSLSLWHHLLGFLTTPLVHRDFVDEICGALVDALGEQPRRARLLMLPMFGTEGPVAEALRAAFAARGCRIEQFDGRTRAALAGHEDAAAYFRGGPHGKRLRTYRRLRRRLGEQGDITFSIAAAGKEFEIAAEDFLALEGSGWKGKRGTAMADNPAQRQFFAEAARNWAKDGTARIASLRIDGRTIAALVLLVSGNRAWTWKIAYDETFAHFSPGVLLMIDLTERLLVDGEFALVDSCAPADYPMIDRVWTERFAVADLYVDLAPGVLSTPLLLAAEKLRRRTRRDLKRAAGAIRRG